MDTFTIADKTFTSRLIVGTGKYASNIVMMQAHEASGAEMVTVAVRRVNISDRSKESLLDYIDTSKYFLLPNTAGCYTAEDAIRTARRGREAGLSNWVKLEVIGDERTLFPDNEALIEATRILVKEGFVVLPYTNDDPIACRKLEDAGAAAVMPLGAPIGSGLGIQNVNNIRIIREFSRVPVIVDAGVGTALDDHINRDAAVAVEAHDASLRTIEWISVVTDRWDEIHRHTESLLARERRNDTSVAALAAQHDELRSSISVLQQAAQNLKREVATLAAGGISNPKPQIP